MPTKKFKKSFCKWLKQNDYSFKMENWCKHCKDLKKRFLNPKDIPKYKGKDRKVSIPAIFKKNRLQKTADVDKLYLKYLKSTNKNKNSFGGINRKQPRIVTKPSGSYRKHNLDFIPQPKWGKFSTSPWNNRAGNAVNCQTSADWLFTNRSSPDFPLNKNRYGNKKLVKSSTNNYYSRRGKTGFKKRPKSIYMPGGSVPTRSYNPYTGAHIGGRLPQPYGPIDNASIKGYPNGYERRGRLTSNKNLFGNGNHSFFDLFDEKSLHEQVRKLKSLKRFSNNQLIKVRNYLEKKMDDLKKIDIQENEEEFQKLIKDQGKILLQLFDNNKLTLEKDYHHLIEFLNMKINDLKYKVSHFKLDKKEKKKIENEMKEIENKMEEIRINLMNDVNSSRSSLDSVHFNNFGLHETEFGPYINQGYNNFGLHETEFGPYINQGYNNFGRYFGTEMDRSQFRPHAIRSWKPNYNSWANNDLYLKSWNPYQKQRRLTRKQKQFKGAANAIDRAYTLNGANQFGLNSGPNNVAYRKPFMMYPKGEIGGNTINWTTRRNYLPPCHNPRVKRLKVATNNNPTGYLANKNVTPVSGLGFGMKQWIENPYNENQMKPWVARDKTAERPYPTQLISTNDAATSGYTRLGQPLSLYSYQNNPNVGSYSYPEFQSNRGFYGGFGNGKTKTKTKTKKRQVTKTRKKKKKVTAKAGDTLILKNGKIRVVNKKSSSK